MKKLIIIIINDKNIFFCKILKFGSITFIVDKNKESYFTKQNLVDFLENFFKRCIRYKFSCYAWG